MIVFQLISILIIHLSFVYAQSINKTCPPGTFRTKAGECKLCPPGTFQATENAPYCNKFERACVNSFQGAKSPTACVTCIQDYIANKEKTKCIPCPKGTISLPGTNNCITCPPGTNAASVSNTVCNPCGNGTFNDQPNRRYSCKQCPAGTYTLKEGSKSISDCIKCEQNTKPKQSSDGCEPCPQGSTYNSITKTCQLCSLGTTSTSTGCKPCPIGQFGIQNPKSLTKQSICQKCADGFNTFAPGATFCRRIGGPCPKDYVTTRKGDCVKCPVDFRYDSVKGMCFPCPYGTGTSGGSQQTCQSCLDWFYDNINSQPDQPGHSRCFEYVITDLFGSAMRSPIKVIKATPIGCPPGTMIVPKYPRFCIQCASGSYSDKFRSTSCKSCPIETVSFPGAIKCRICPDGMIRGSRNTNCVIAETGCRKGEAVDTSQFGLGTCAPDCGNGKPAPFPIKRDICTKKITTFLGCSGCETCPNGQVRDVFLSFDIRKCTCAGPYRGLQDGKCIQCPLGSYGKVNSSIRNQVCVKCPPGTYYVKVPEENVKGKEQGTFGLPFPCRKCPINTFTSESGSLKCIKCPKGTFTYGTGESNCLPLK